MYERRAQYIRLLEEKLRSNEYWDVDQVKHMTDGKLQIISYNTYRARSEARVYPYRERKSIS